MAYRSVALMSRWRGAAAVVIVVVGDVFDVEGAW